MGSGDRASRILGKAWRLTVSRRSFLSHLSLVTRCFLSALGHTWCHSLHPASCFLLR